LEAIGSWSQGFGGKVVESAVGAVVAAEEGGGIPTAAHAVGGDEVGLLLGGVVGFGAEWGAVGGCALVVGALAMAGIGGELAGTELDGEESFGEGEAVGL
jgi:hypothetical protein